MISAQQESYAELVPEDWGYLGEGNLHLLLKYRGRDARFCGRLLRIEKVVVGEVKKPDGVDRMQQLAQEVYIRQLKAHLGDLIDVSEPLSV